MNLLKISHDLKNDWDFFYHNFFKVVDKKQLLVLILPIFTFGYHAITMPISCDEAWTFNNFTYKGLISTLIDYPLPNNHILYSIFTNFFYLFTTPIICLRLPVVIISIITLLFSLYTLNKLYNSIVSTIATGIMSVLCSTLYYSYLGRGYAFVLFFFILSFYIVHKISKEPENIILWIQLTMFTIAGLYTNPTFFYASIFNYLLLIYYIRLSQIKKYLTSIVSIGFITFILYTPIIFTKGLKVLINNKWVAPISRIQVIEELPNFLFNTIEELTAINGWLFIIIFLSIAILMIIKKIKNIQTLFLLTFALPPILLIIHSIIAYSRVFNYYNFLFAIIIALTIYSIFKKISFKYTLFLTVFLQLIFVANFFKEIKIKEDYAIKTNKVIAEIYLPSNFYLLSSDLFDTYLYYEFNSNKRSSEGITNKRLTLINVDTVQTFSYIIIDHTFDRTKNKIPFIKNEYYSVYKNDTYIK
jgi:hypothetical protein